MRVLARLPRPLAHAAGVALHGLFYVLRGRGDADGSQRAAIWAIDPRSPAPRLAGRLPVALSDPAATAARRQADRRRRARCARGVHAEMLRLR